jgi:hypothetical protein
LLGLASYIFVAYCWNRIGERLEDDTPTWQWYVPMWNFTRLIRAAGINPHWGWLLLAPFVFMAGMAGFIGGAHGTGGMPAGFGSMTGFFIFLILMVASCLGIAVLTFCAYRLAALRLGRTYGWAYGLMGVAGILSLVSAALLAFQDYPSRPAGTPEPPAPATSEEIAEAYGIKEKD